MRWLGGIFLALLGLAALLLAAVGALLGTDRGVAWSLRQAQQLAPETLALGQVQGNLFGRLELTDVGLALATADIRARRLVLAWSPGGLLQGELRVDEIRLDGLRYAGLPGPEEPPPEPLQWPIELPEFAPPLRLVLGEFALDDAEIIPAPEAAPLRIDAARLRAHWDRQGLVIEELASQGPGYALQLTGSLDPLQAYALRLDNRLEWRGEGGEALDLAGSLSGDRLHLDLEQRVTGSARLALRGALDEPLVAPRWSAELTVEELPGTLLSPELPLVLSGVVEGSGDLAQLGLVAALVSASEQRELNQLRADLKLDFDLERQDLSLQQLELTQQDQPGRVSLVGRVGGDGALDLRGEWAALRWPLVLVPEPDYRIDAGRLSLLGNFSDYRLEVTTELGGAALPAGAWNLVGQGDRSGLAEVTLSGQLFAGSLVAKGAVGWSPETVWALELRGRGLNPWQGTDLEGLVDIDASSEGRLGASGDEALLVLQRLSGTLNGVPLEGGGELRYGGGRTVIDGLQLRNGDALARVEGVIDEQADLSWTLQVPALGRLIAGAGGAVSSQGRVSGPRQQPRVVGEFQARAVELESVAVAELAGRVDLDLQDRRRSTLSVTGRALGQGEQVLDDIDLRFEGFIREHRIALGASNPQARLELSAAGGYRDGRWDGELRKLDLSEDRLGPWRLQRPVALSLAASEARAGDLCLQRERARLCASGDWQAGGAGRARFALADLPMDWLRPFLPDDILEFGGQLRVDGEVEAGAGAALAARVDASVSPGNIVFLGPVDRVAVPHRAAQLSVKTEGRGLVGQLGADLGASRLGADVRLPDLLAVGDRAQAVIDGSLRLALPDLNIVPLLAPSVSAIDGSLKARFDIGGRLGDPLLKGGGELLLARLEADRLGLALVDSRVGLRAANRRLLIDGELVSGGRIALDGALELDAARDWPLRLDITGQRFVALDLPTLQLLISPELKVRRDAAGVTLNGRLTIPKAEVLIRDLPEGARSASADVVVLREGSEEVLTAQTTPLTTDITVALGDKVHVAALGFDGFVRGGLRLRGSAGRPLRATGDIRIDEGTFRAYGQELEIERGLFSYTSSPLDNPGVNVRAIRSIEEVVVGVNALGTARSLTVSTFSTPSMSENDRISYLVTGRPAREGAKFSVNRQVYKNLSVGVSVDTHTGERAFVSRYRLHRTLYTEVSSSSRSSAMDLFFTIERH